MRPRLSMFYIPNTYIGYGVSPTNLGARYSVRKQLAYDGNVLGFQFGVGCGFANGAKPIPLCVSHILLMGTPLNILNNIVGFYTVFMIYLSSRRRRFAVKREADKAMHFLKSIRMQVNGVVAIFIGVRGDDPFSPSALPCGQAFHAPKTANSIVRKQWAHSPFFIGQINRNRAVRQFSSVIASVLTVFTRLAKSIVSFINVKRSRVFSLLTTITNFGYNRFSQDSFTSNVKLLRLGVLGC